MSKQELKKKTVFQLFNISHLNCCLLSSNKNKNKSSNSTLMNKFTTFQ